MLPRAAVECSEASQWTDLGQELDMKRKDIDYETHMLFLVHPGVFSRDVHDDLIF